MEVKLNFPFNFFFFKIEGPGNEREKMKTLNSVSSDLQV